MMDHSEEYVQGKLSEEEQKAFSKELSPEGRQELAFDAGVADAVQGELRKKLSTQVQGFESRAKRGIGATPYWIGGIAASLILLVGVIYIFSGRGDGSLYETYYESYPNYEMTITRGEEDLNLLQKAYQAYDLQNYERAEALFTRALVMEENFAVSFFRGMSRMEQQKFEPAIESFLPVLNAGGDYQEAAIWYSALSHIKLEQWSLAKDLLDRLTESEEFGARATQLLEDL